MRHTCILRVLMVLTLAQQPAAAVAGQIAPPLDVRAQASDLVARIRRADYEGDRTALERLERQLAALAADQALASRLHYWRGFAKWRRAINGFNDSTPPAELQADLEDAIGQFEAAGRLDPTFADATIGHLSCLGYLLYLGRTDAVLVKDLTARYQSLAAAATKLAPDNPRLLWVIGPSRWYGATRAPASEVAAGQAAVIALYERGLRLSRDRKPGMRDPLEPDWGEPELLMSLAWSYLNKAVPDPVAAEQCALKALELVPHWHYTRDILLPQIRRAKNPAGQAVG